MGQTKLGESKISHEAFSPLKLRFFREAMRGKNNYRSTLQQPSPLRGLWHHLVSRWRAHRVQSLRKPRLPLECRHGQKAGTLTDRRQAQRYHVVAQWAAPGCDR